MSDTKLNHTNSFFNIYKRNIAGYYNAKKILKIINEGTTNIPPNVSEMLIVFEENREKIKTFNSDAYEKHYKLIKRILYNLFNIENQQRSLLNSFIKPGIASFSTYMEYINKYKPSISNGMQSISNFTRKKYSEMPGLPTDQATFGVVSDEFNKQHEKQKLKRKIKTEYQFFLNELAKRVFTNYDS
tara:strand:- start:356 stop:913 length:558 start_codon:yes stop_codon:yes gene_type:complete